MKRRVKLPKGKAIDIHYDETVYSPHYSSVDTIVLADFIGRAGDKVLDLSCGSGITGLAVKYLRPELEVHLTDNSEDAVRVTKENAENLNLDVEVFQADLGDERSWDMVIANLPTYTKEDMKQELHGPDATYFSHEKDGLYLYKKLFGKIKLNPGGILICECQEKLQDSFVKLAYNNGYKLAIKNDFGFAFTK